MTDFGSALGPALKRLSRRSTRAIVGRARLVSPGLNAELLRELDAPLGEEKALLTDPVFEAARAWKPAPVSFGELAGDLFDPALVAALDGAKDPQRMPRDRAPYAHQLAAWQASLRDEKSVLVTAGTGAGKTECFLLPILQDILAHRRPGGGIRAILLYPLNALIESQRERLAAWAEGLGGQVRFALFNGDTPETEREATVKSGKIELRSREAIRARPPEILVTNITMLEYLLLRSKDQAILETSAEALRWIVLDEAHSYVGSQAAEMALLLRRVRKAFRVEPKDVRLMATSATIGGEANATMKLAAYAAALAGRDETDVTIVEGQEDAPILPAVGPDVPLVVSEIAALEAEQAGTFFAPHPRMQALRQQLASEPVPLHRAAHLLFDDPARSDDAQALLDLAARATRQGQPFLPWRAHLFHRAQGGVWACADPTCTRRSPVLAAEGAGWPFGNVYLSARARCDCGAPVYEVVGCTECGTVYLQGRLKPGSQPRLEPTDPGEGDDFALDSEPEEEDATVGEAQAAWLAPGAELWIDQDGWVFDNAPPKERRAWRYRLVETAEDRSCCRYAARARLQGLRFGPAFLMGATLPGVLEDLAPPLGPGGLPSGGRRALTFSDSRQGVARLAAKLQQESERTLTRAFLWHAVQEGPQVDPAELAKLQDDASRLRVAGLADLAEDKERELAKLTGAQAAPITWKALVDRLAGHTDLSQFAGELWRGRATFTSLAEDPTALARAFLYRELFRRPRVQNNPETMGLLRLSFPKLEDKARLQKPPQPLLEAGLDSEGWVGLALAAVDAVFRNNFAVHLENASLARLINPRQPGLRSIFSAHMARDSVSTRDAIYWPSAFRQSGRMPRLVELVFGLIEGSPESQLDQDRAEEVLEALWRLISTTAARDTGAGAFRLDFEQNAAVVRLDQAWLCPVTRRPYGFSLSGRSPNDPAQRMEKVSWPRLPCANAGGLTANERIQVAQWCEADPSVAALRARGLWSDLHDRIATFPPYVRAQEHSAQISRPVLQRYEEAFRGGRINLLNCSTTMEMGVDIADVRLVVNGNVPPALSNYRQRAGRAGRRGDPWAFTLTYCRDLPLDWRVFDAPTEYLQRKIVAPKVWLDSASLVHRHVNAALLAAWLGEKGGLDVRGSVGAFFGATADAEQPVADDNLADRFLGDLDGSWGKEQVPSLEALVIGTALASVERTALVAACRVGFDALVSGWRQEYRLLLEGAAGAADRDARLAQEFRAKRLAGEFLLGELARRGFTPAYGFPTDVVAFANLAYRPDTLDEGQSLMRRGTATRTLDQAIREYAPGSEVVIDGLVHECEGVLPAWEAGADASRLEDLRELWSCDACHSFGVDAAVPEACPSCGHAPLDGVKVLRPAGFLGAKRPHVGYEYLSHVPADPPKISAQGGEWVALPEGAGRMRADPAGQLAVTSAGKHGGGYAICLDCGRAAPMELPVQGLAQPLPEAMRRHAPLFRGRQTRLTRDGLCAGSDTPQRIQRHVRLAQVARTDVWEWQLPEGTAEPAARALAAAIREALAERLGVEPSELAPAAGPSSGLSSEARISAFLLDRAAGGAGLSARLSEMEMLVASLDRAEQLLNCPDDCAHGCPACIMRPDLNQRGLTLDRPGAWELARTLRSRLDLPSALRVFGAESRLAGRPLTQEIAARSRSSRLTTLDIWLQGDPAQWALEGWPLRPLLPRLKDAGVTLRVHLPTAVLTAAGLDLGRKLALHGIAAFARLHRGEAPQTAGGHSIIARLTDGAGRSEAVAVTAAAEALPGPSWGAGSEAPMIVGEAPDLELGPVLSPLKLIELGTGNARLLWPGDALDGPIAGFGKRFWEYLAREAPIEITAMRAAGVTRLSYSDRYLLQPYTLRLLAEVLGAAPGGQQAAREVVLARADRLPTDPRFVHDGFPNDATRQDVLAALIAGGKVKLGDKDQMPHHRALKAELADGRTLLVLLDQGFGGWRVEGTTRHEFAVDATLQARRLRDANFRVASGATSGAPIALNFE